MMATSDQYGYGSEDGHDTVRDKGYAHAFREAKKSVLTIFGSIEENIKEADRAISECPVDIDKISEEYRNTKKWFPDCRKFLEKEKMKVVIFGSTSSGKSTTTNAILHKRVLECGMGHVTNCIFQIQGSEEIEKSTFRINDGDEQGIEQLEQYLDGEKKFKSDWVVYVTCPTKEHKQLNPDVIILDCPGLDRTSEQDSLIYKHCWDADVFVVVSDAKSTIRNTELSFFENIEDPTVFVLFNCWDLTEKNEKEKKRAVNLKKQHTKDAVGLLQKSNKYLQEQSLNQRVYFVSAEEYLEKHDPSKEYVFCKGHDDREHDFHRFEVEFWISTTTSALQTRFAARIANGKQRLQNLEVELLKISDFLKEKRDELQIARDSIQNQKESLEHRVMTTQEEKTIQEILYMMEEDTIRKFAQDFNDEQKDKEEMDNEELQEYMKAMHGYIEKQIQNKMKETNTEYIKNVTENDYKLPDNLPFNEEENEFKQSQNFEELEYEAPDGVDPTYKWAFPPYRLWKKIRHRKYYRDQPTTSSSHATLSTGFTIATAVGGAICGTIFLPLISIPVVAGIATLYIHHKYEEHQWNMDRKLKYMEDVCVASIQCQFEEKKSELEKRIHEREEELHQFLSERIKKSEDVAEKNILILSKLQNSITMLTGRFRKNRDDFSSFENRYLLQEDLQSIATRAQFALPDTKDFASMATGSISQRVSSLVKSLKETGFMAGSANFDDQGQLTHRDAVEPSHLDD